jgi:arylsulfatase A-like enzyme
MLGGVPEHRRSTWRRASAGVLGALCFASAVACARPPAPRRASCIWIVEDTLRADHLEQYGYGRLTAPDLRPLVEQGTLFEHAYTTLPETTPAIASMLTSLYPYRHGVEDLYQLLNDRNVTAPQLLGGAGYATGAFVSSFVMIRYFSHFSRGFQIYDDHVDERELHRENYKRRASLTLARARAWIEAHRDVPFFCFIHLIEPHGPYAAPGVYATKFRSPVADPIAISRIPAYQLIPGVTDANRYRDQYDGAISYASHELGDFFADLERDGLFGPSLIVFSADHGEAMGEHGSYFAHGQDLFEQNVHVPLIVKAPAASPARRGGRVAEVVSVIDILPTILEALGLARPDFFEGQSLLPLMAGPGQRSAMATRRAAFASRSVFLELHLRHPLAASVRGWRKSIAWPDRLAQFDLVKDGAERAPLAAALSDPVAIAELRAWQSLSQRWRRDFVVDHNDMDYARRGAFIRGRGKVDETVQRLRSLGYL